MQLLPQLNKSPQNNLTKHYEQYVNKRKFKEFGLVRTQNHGQGHSVFLHGSMKWKGG